MNWSNSIRTMLSVLTVSALAACGGGGDGDGSGDQGAGDGGAAPVATAEGFYTGSSSNGRSLSGVVLDDGRYWLMYAPSGNSSAIAGVVQGNSTANGGTFASGDGRDFNFEGDGMADLTVAGSHVARQSISGNLTYKGTTQPYAFTVAYDASYAQPVTLAAIAGSYAGAAGTLFENEAASFTVSASGAISGMGASGCRFTGTVAPRGTVAVYNLTLSFLGGVCEQGTSTLSGVAYTDPKTKQLFGVALNAQRSNGALFVGQKTTAATAQN